MWLLYQRKLRTANQIDK